MALKSETVRLSGVPPPCARACIDSAAPWVDRTTASEFRTAESQVESKIVRNGMPTSALRSTPSNWAAAGLASTMTSVAESRISTGSSEAANIDSDENEGGVWTSWRMAPAETRGRNSAFDTTTAYRFEAASHIPNFQKAYYREPGIAAKTLVIER